MIGKAATLALTLLAATSGTALATEWNYDCADGIRLTATYSAPDVQPGSVVLVFAGSSETITLPQVMSADGGRYADGSAEFWDKGVTATLTRDGKAVTCHRK
jgi:membrane-bound inhibitor of C-type lysozyme